MRCPNASRKKRLGPGGGTPGCRGKLEIVVVTTVTIPLKGWGGRARLDLPSWTDAVPKRIQRSGVRVRPGQLVEAYCARGKGAHLADVRCASCAWSLRRMFDSLQASLCSQRRRTGR